MVLFLTKSTHLCPCFTIKVGKTMGAKVPWLLDLSKKARAMIYWKHRGKHVVNPSLYLMHHESRYVYMHAILTLASTRKVGISLVAFSAVAEVTWATGRISAHTVIAAASIWICFHPCNIAALIANCPVQYHRDIAIMFINKAICVQICCAELECTSLHDRSIATIICTVCDAYVGCVVRFIEIHRIVGHVAGECNLAAADAVTNPISCCARVILVIIKGIGWGLGHTPNHLLHKH